MNLFRSLDLVMTALNRVFFIKDELLELKYFSLIGAD